MSPDLRSQLRDSTEKILANRHWLNQFLPAPSLPSLSPFLPEHFDLPPTPFLKLQSKFKGLKKQETLALGG